MTSAGAVEDHLFTAVANETTFLRSIVGMALQHSGKTHSNPRLNEWQAGWLEGDGRWGHHARWGKKEHASVLTRQDSSKPDTKAPGFPVYSLRNQPLGACHLQRALSAGLISSSIFDTIVATVDSVCVHSHTIA